MQKISVNMQQMGRLTWHNNSCFIDTVLFALFASPNSFLDNLLVTSTYKPGKQEILHIRDWIQRKGQGREMKENIRQSLSGCKNPVLSTFGQEDAASFLNYLFSYLEIPYFMQVVTIKASMQRNGQLICTAFDANSQHDFTLEAIENKNQMKLSDILQEMATFKHHGLNVFKATIIKASKFMIFNVQGQRERKTKIFPDMQLMGNILSAVIAYNGRSHYTVYFRSQEKYYYYDNLSSQKFVEMTYTEMLQWIATSGILYFYVCST
jgi:hypothetical protein